MAPFDWAAWAEASCQEVAAAGRWRAPRSFDAAGPTGTMAAGALARAGNAVGDRPGGADAPTELVSFASNDYLGLTQHPAVVAAAHEALDRWGAGSGAARLVVGSRPVHHELEAAIASWKGSERAVLFPTGFAANLGVLTTMAGPGVRVLSDELNHASIIDGCRLARAQVSIVAHRDLDHLAALLAASDEPTVVVTDTVFSMDGDVADLDGLLMLCANAGALVVLDEAHAVLGPEPGPHGATVLRVGTLSKTLGTLGGFVAGPDRFCSLIENRARSYIFTTAATPADTAGALAALGVVRSPEGDRLRVRLRAHVDRVAPGHPSPVIPVVIGDEADAVAASAVLAERGLLVPAIRPPTVAPGTSRLRVALSAAHTVEQVDALVAALTDLGLDERLPGANGAEVPSRSGPERSDLGPTTDGWRRPRTAGGIPRSGGRAQSGEVVRSGGRTPGGGVARLEGAERTGVAVGGPARPEMLVVIVGTATEVGKTWVAAGLAGALRAEGLTVGAWKPAQSFDPGDDATDADVLAAATGQRPHEVCPPHRWYEVPMAPPMAADALGRPPLSLADLVPEQAWPPGTQIGLVETAGGVRSPLADDGDSVDLIAALAPDLVILVADAGLGTVHAVRAAAGALDGGLMVLLNRFDDASDLHGRNRRWLADTDGFDVCTDVGAGGAYILAQRRAMLGA